MLKFSKKSKKSKWTLATLKSTQDKYITIKKSKIPKAGKGAFAKIDIPKGTNLGWYRGKRLSEKAYQKTKNTDYVWYIDSTKDYRDGRVIKTNNALRYVNSAIGKKQRKGINVDTFFRNHEVWYKTKRKIKKGEEILVCYGDEYFD